MSYVARLLIDYFKVVLLKASNIFFLIYLLHAQATFLSGTQNNVHSSPFSNISHDNTVRQTRPTDNYWVKLSENPSLRVKQHLFYPLYHTDYLHNEVYDWQFPSHVYPAIPRYNWMMPFPGFHGDYGTDYGTMRY